MADPEPRTRDATRARPWAAYLIAPAGLIGALLAFALLRTAPGWLMPAALVAVLGAGITWIVVSALSPARADRTCPRCAGEDLQRLDPRSTRGVRCDSCGFVDTAASSFYLAEEEGPLESIVIAERRTRARAR